MNESKGKQLGAMLAAMLLVSMAFMPAVNAQVENSSEVPGQCNTCEGACNGTQTPAPKVNSNILQG